LPLNIFVLCGQPGTPVVKRVATTADVQRQLEPYFTALEGGFREGVADEVDFDGRWKPDRDQLLRVPVTDEVLAIIAELQPDALALDSITPDGFENEEIRALLVKRSTGQRSRLILQAFSAQQRLSRRFALTQSGNVFNRLSDVTFSLDSKVHVIVEGGLIKFHTFNMAKRIFDLSQIYQEATDRDIEELCGMRRVSGDAEAIIAAANPTLRKLISSVKSSTVFRYYTANQISEKAASVNIEIPVRSHRVVLPTERADLRKVFTFLDHGVYMSPVSNQRYIANSRRALP
jgi:hypothetical protein